MFLRNILKVISENGLREHLSPNCFAATTLSNTKEYVNEITNFSFYYESDKLWSDKKDEYKK